MSKFKVLLIGGIGLGVLAGGTVALFMSGQKTASTSPAQTSAPIAPSAPAPPAAAPAQAPAGGSALSNTTPPAAPVTAPAATSATRSKPIKKATAEAEAAALNEQGKELLLAGKWSEAESVFRRAFATASKPLYLNNVALALVQQGKFEEGMVSIRQLLKLDLSDDLRRRANGLFQRAVAECKAQRLECGSTTPP